MSARRSKDDLTKLEAALAAHAESGAPRLSGPVQVLSAVSSGTGGRHLEVSTSALVQVDPHDPALEGVSIPVPVTASVDLDRRGAVVGVAVPPVDPEAAREARAYARSLIDNGAVRGLKPTEAAGPSFGPPARPTHELVTDEHGAKVIRRTGFSVAR